MEWWVYAIIWGIVFITTVAVEISTVDLTSIWFSVSSLIALFLSLFKVSIYIQLGVFVGLSIILIIATRPLVKKMMNKETIHTNADKVLDMIGIVTKDINVGEIGEVRVNSELWRAVSLETEDLIVGEKVIINSFTGNKVLVSKANKNNIEIL